MCHGCCFLQLFLRALGELDPATKGGWKDFYLNGLAGNVRFFCQEIGISTCVSKMWIKKERKVQKEINKNHTGAFKPKVQGFGVSESWLILCCWVECIPEGLGGGWPAFLKVWSAEETQLRLSQTGSGPNLLQECLPDLCAHIQQLKKLPFLFSSLPRHWLNRSLVHFTNSVSRMGT